MDQNILLEASNISKSYNDQQVISNLNLQVIAGEILAIVGVSGAGKSTLLRILSGIESYDEGEVAFDQIPLEKVEDSLVPGHEEIQYVAQDFYLLKNRSVLENLKEALLAFKAEYTSQKIEFLLTKLGLCHLQEKRIELLSGGEKQRLAIARAMASEPAMLMLDEPFTQLDQINRQLLIDAIIAINNSLDTTIVLVTHQADEVFQLADRVGVLQKQQLVQLNSPEKVFRSPVNDAVAHLFGPINILNTDFISAMKMTNSESLFFAVRPQYMNLSLDPGPDLIEAKVIRRVFMGAFNLLTLDTLYQKGLLAYHYEQNITVGDKVFINVKNEHLMSWNVD